jgi:hypothetical protein
MINHVAMRTAETNAAVLHGEAPAYLRMSVAPTITAVPPQTSKLDRTDDFIILYTGSAAAQVTYGPPQTAPMLNRGLVRR